LYSLKNPAAESIKRRISDVSEVVNVDFENEPTQKIKVFNKRYKCLLPEQRVTNPKCKMKTTEIVEISNNLGLDYNDVVNMHDLTGLDTVEFINSYSFTDKYQVPASTETVQLKPRLRRTSLNFLDKFGDP